MRNSLTVEEGFRRLRDQIGVPIDGPRFPTGRLKPGQMVTVLLLGDERSGRARATGKKNQKGEHILWYRDMRGRKWRLSLSNECVLVDED